MYESARKGGKTDAQEVSVWAIKNCCNWMFSLAKCGKCREAGKCSVAAELEREAAQ